MARNDQKSNDNLLIIATDCGAVEWLSYIIEEFSRINKAEFEIVIEKPNRLPVGTNNIIYYTKKFQTSPGIPNCAFSQPKCYISWLSKSIFVIENTVVQDWPEKTDYDIFWNAFVFLSRLEEFIIESAGTPIRSYLSRHKRLDKTTFQTPIVNNLFDTLEELIKRHFPSLTFGDRETPVIEYSHDVDYIRKTFLGIARQSALYTAQCLRNIHQPKFVRDRIGKCFSGILLKNNYWCFDDWISLEKSFNVRSIFYIYANIEKKGFCSCFFDPEYNVFKNKRLLMKLYELLNNGFEIGLHGSIGSSMQSPKMESEKRALENALHVPITKVRQHWLNYFEHITPYLHEEFFSCDSTLGWNDQIGFRSGCASRYRPWNHQAKRPFAHMVTPLIASDSTLFHYNQKSPDRLTCDIMDHLKQLKIYKTAQVSISWHQRGICRDLGWAEPYKEILRFIQNNC
ncbi:hypothetical protein C4565_04980 [Candidatus Parcubacteria bacterium]|nr:MAG: hypothetical protein C4565_04980 [Candidatus Parcubacteria bacterium]